MTSDGSCFNGYPEINLPKVRPALRQIVSFVRLIFTVELYWEILVVER